MFVSIMKGMALMSVTTMFQPFIGPPCSTDAEIPCRLASRGQNTLFYPSFIFMATAAGGIILCSVAFGTYQFQYTSESVSSVIQMQTIWHRKNIGK